MDGDEDVDATNHFGRCNSDVGWCGCAHVFPDAAGETRAGVARMAGEFSSNGGAEEGKVAEARAERRITTENMPTLLKWISPSSREAFWWWRVRARGYELLRPMEQAPEPPWDIQLAALFGFAVLGSNGAVAIPELVRSFKSSPGLYEKNALVYIGEDSWAVATELASAGSAKERGLCAFLLGALRIHESASVEVLLRLLQDKELVVRTEASRALAEFPCEKTEFLFSEMLEVAGDAQRFKEGAYGLHTGGTNAMKRLVAAYESTTNRELREIVLETFAFRERVQWNEKTGAYLRGFYYSGKWDAFVAEFGQVRRNFLNPKEEEDLWGAVRANVMAGEEPDISLEIARRRSTKWYFRPQKGAAPSSTNSFKATSS